MNSFNKNRRKFLGTAAAASTVFAATPYIRTANAQAGEVNIWTYDGFVPKAFKEQFVKDTGIQVNLRPVGDQVKQFNLLAAEAPEPTVDIVTVAGHRFLQFIDSELLAPLNTNRLGNWGGINPIYSESDWSDVNGNKWGAPILSSAEVLAYNTELVLPDEARSWDVLFSEKYKQQTAYIIQDMMSIVMLYKGYDGNLVEYLDDPKEAARIVEEARDFLIEHKPLVHKYYESGAEVQQMFLDQDIALAHAWNRPIAKLINDGCPVEMTIPKEGSYGIVYTMNVTNNAPNADNAYTFLNALLASAEIGASMSRSTGFISTYKDAGQYLNELEKKSTAFTDEELAGLKFFRAEANEMKYDLVEPAVKQIEAA